MVSTASLLGAWHLRNVVKNKPESSLFVSLGKVVNEMPPYVEDRCSRHLGNGNSQANAIIPSTRQRYNSIFREWRLNMDNKIKLIHFLTTLLLADLDSPHHIGTYVSYHSISSQMSTGNVIFLIC